MAVHRKLPLVHLVVFVSYKLIVECHARPLITRREPRVLARPAPTTRTPRARRGQSCWLREPPPPTAGAARTGGRTDAASGGSASCLLGEHVEEHGVGKQRKEPKQGS